MAAIIGVSFKESEKDLYNYLQDLVSEKKISPSQFFKEQLREKKRAEDLLQETNIGALQKRLDLNRDTIKGMMDFIKKKKLEEEWFNTNQKEDKDENHHK